MMIRKVLFATSVIALASTPAWALPSQTPSNGGTAHAPETTPAGPPSSTPSEGSNPGSRNRSETGTTEAGHAEAGHTAAGHAEGAGSASESHSGGHSSTPNASSHGKGEGKGESEGKGEGGKSRRCIPHKVAYTVAGILLSGMLTEEEGSARAYKGEVEVEVKRTNHHAHPVKGTTQTYALEGVRVKGPVSVTAIAQGDWVRLIGKVTALPRRCEAGEFTPTVTIERIVVHKAHSHGG